MKKVNAMKHTQLKKYAKWMQQRNPGMKYTTAKRLNENAPVIEHPEGNIAVIGCVGSGCTVTAQWLAAQLHHEGYPLTYIDSHREFPNDFMLTVTDRIYGYGVKENFYDDRIDGVYEYLTAMRSAVRGTKNQPAAIVMDNFDYVVELANMNRHSQITKDFINLYRELLEDDYTCVITRMALYSSMENSLLDVMDLYSNILLMSNRNYDKYRLRLPQFKEYYSEYKSIDDYRWPIGTGFLWKKGKGVMQIHIPFDSTLSYAY